MTKQPKPTKPAAVPEIAENQKAASSAWGIPVSVLKAAKASGCPAFQGSRVHRQPLLAWLRLNASAAATATAADIARADKQELELVKLRAQARLLVSKADLSEEVVIPKEAAKAEWARAMAVVEEEAKSLMESDHYRIFVDRCKSRIGEVLP